MSAIPPRRDCETNCESMNCKDAIFGSRAGDGTFSTVGATDSTAGVTGVVVLAMTVRFFPRVFGEVEFASGVSQPGGAANTLLFGMLPSEASPPCARFVVSVAAGKTLVDDIFSASVWIVRGVAVGDF